MRPDIKHTVAMTASVLETAHKENPDHANRGRISLKTGAAPKRSFNDGLYVEDGADQQGVWARNRSTTTPRKATLVLRQPLRYDWIKGRIQARKIRERYCDARP